MKFGTNVQLNMHQLSRINSDMMSYYQDGGHNIISPRKLPLPAECTRNATASIN